MKSNPVIFILCLLFSMSLSQAQTTAVPDANFENYLETHTEDGTLVNVGDASSMGDGIANNGFVSTNRISEVVLLDVSNLGISDLTGIEDFTALETLICSNNNLSILNISNNTNLVSLLCGSNSLTGLIVDNNTNLETLNCSDNQIQSLSLTNNTNLKNLTASGNQLATIDVFNNTHLTLLSVSNNRIAGELIVSNNTNLESLFCASNQISTLNLASNILLKNLDASDNALTTLDLSTINTVVCPNPQTDPITVCQATASLNVSRNQLNSLNVASGFNNLISTFNASDNPDLFCIQIDDGFIPSGWIKDDWAYYSDDTCVDIYTYVPDDNFEQALIDLGHDDVLDNLVLTANIDALTILDVSNASISSLIGIEDFSALEILDCGTNSIESLDLSANVALLQISVTNNDLTALDVSTNTLLSELYCANNFIEEFDLSNNSALTILNCSNNALTNLNLGGNPTLSDVDCSFNQLERLDVTANTALTSVLCNDNNLFALEINNGNNTLMTTFDATNNTNLFCIEVDDVAFANVATGWQKDAMANYNLDCGTYVPDDNFEQTLIDQGIDSDGTLNNFVATADINTLTVLDVSGLGIADLTGIEDFVALQDLNCSNNNLSILDLSANTALQALDCSNNQIQDLDVTLNTVLTALICNDNALTTLNIENGNNMALTIFNAMNNSTLFCINVDNTIVANIPASWQKDPTASYNGDCTNNRFTAIPDAFFEQALIDLGYDDVIDAQVLTPHIEHIQNLDVSDKSIEDLTGIQDFKSLVELDCSSNFLDQLDVSGMLFLERLNCSSNYLLTNDVNDTSGLLNTTGTESLRELFCSGNNLNNLDTSQNTNLEVLDCADNDLTVLIISNNLVLRTLNCSNNDLSSLDISTNPALEEVNCDSNQISSLTTSGILNSTLSNLSCVNNALSELLVSNYQTLRTLNCGSNNLTQLVVTANTALVVLSVSNNQISDIELLNNSDLEVLSVSQNDLTELILTNNTALKRLNCSFNNITQLVLDANPSLEFLSCANNQLTTLNLANNDNLIEVDFSSNMMSSLTLANDLGDLKRINASNNRIEGDVDLTTIAISACVFQPNQTEFCPETIAINVSNNLLDFVNIQNGINTDIASFNATGNPNLECIQVDNVNTIGANWLKDNTAEYNEDCNFGETFVPDDNFEQALIDLGLDTLPLNDYILTANIETLTNLDLSDSAIADLTGIEDFMALEALNVSNNALTELDVSQNTNLLSLDCSSNVLSELNITNNTALTTLNSSSNTISSLDLSANTNLSNLNISNNAFTVFEPSEVPTLAIFNCDANTIVELNFQQNQLLTSLSCQSNLLDTLNIQNGQNAILTSLNATNNPDLICIETDDGTAPAGATWTIDTTAQFAMECFFGQTFVPDDNFEQALINLGYDSGDLDDYVSTENIQDIEFLNVSGQGISDITGIEAFISLITLDMEDNTIAMLDLSNNGLLVDLDASGNALTDLDLSVLPNLTVLDVSNNSLTQVNLDTNVNLVDIDVSNNALTVLEVDALADLEELICASNQLNSLSVTQNPNLTQLFCQSNMLVADQLNIQNGNNQNLVLFNATNNPDLGCILVDDPVAVISNVDGVYDNWLKDDSASYQTICADADNDGVPNENDLCPATVFGAAVDLFGCAVPNLPNDNFMISITGEACLNSNNGKIGIVAQEIYNYTVSLFSEDLIETTGEDFYQEYNFTNDIDIFNLLAGTYEMCITIEEWPDYQRCYTIVITQPNPLNVFTNRIALGNEVSVNMSGSSSYNIKFNDDTFTTHHSTITLELQQGINTLTVRTDLECQGVYQERIVVTDDFLVYPNPFNNLINIYSGGEDEEVKVSIYSVFGQLALKKSIISKGNGIKVDTSSLASGIYLITLQTAAKTSTYKMVKE